MRNKKRDLKDRFDEKVNKDPGHGPNGNCWIWIAGTDEKGYGRINYEGKNTYSHIISYKIYIGEVQLGMCVLHRCDNPQCVRPDHLFIGTKGDNIRDCISKGRHKARKGSDVNTSKLTEDKVKKIFYLYSKENVTLNELSKIYNVTEQAIHSIVKFKNWKHLNLRSINEK